MTEAWTLMGEARVRTRPAPLLPPGQAGFSRWPEVGVAVALTLHRAKKARFLAGRRPVSAG